MNGRMTSGISSRIQRIFAVAAAQHTERSFVHTYQDGIANALIEKGFAPSEADKEAVAVARRAYQLGGDSAILDMKSERPMAWSMGASTFASGVLLAGLGWESGFVASCLLTSVVGVGLQAQLSRKLDVLENDLEIIKGQKDPSSLGFREFEKCGADILRNSGYLLPKEPLGKRIVCRLTHRPTAQ